MNFESDEECIADYGAFGWQVCNCSACNPQPISRTITKKKSSWQQRVSSDFNRYMIDLFNERK